MVVSRSKTEWEFELSDPSEEELSVEEDSIDMSHVMGHIFRIVSRGKQQVEEETMVTSPIVVQTTTPPPPTIVPIATTMQPSGELSQKMTLVGATWTLPPKAIILAMPVLGFGQGQTLVIMIPLHIAMTLVALLGAPPQIVEVKSPTTTIEARTSGGIVGGEAMVA